LLTRKQLMAELMEVADVAVNALHSTNYLMGVTQAQGVLLEGLLLVLLTGKVLSADAIQQVFQGAAKTLDRAEPTASPTLHAQLETARKVLGEIAEAHGVDLRQTRAGNGKAERPRKRSGGARNGTRAVARRTGAKSGRARNPNHKESSSSL
jgi:hypothetical protein